MSDRVFAPPCEVRSRQQTYQVDAFLGRGGFGESYRGRAADGRPVTIKVLRPERLESWKAFDLFEREARALGMLDHPRVPRLVELFPMERERVVLVSTYVPGRSLQTILDSGERPDEARLSRWTRELLDVLAYLHTRPEPIIHRDIKPSNIVIDDGDGAHLIDFGAIQNKILAAGQSGSTMIGTLGYFPPEQLLGRAVPASDLYALGMTVLVALTGKPPDQQEVVPSSGKVIAPPGTPPTLARFIHAVVDPAPGHRPATAAAARSVLDGTLQPIAAGPALPAVAQPVALTAGQKTQRWIFRGVLGAGAGAAGAINLFMFNSFSETELVQLAPFWVAPIVFGIAGLVALPRRGALAMAFGGAALGLVLLYVFLVGIFPSL